GAGTGGSGGGGGGWGWGACGGDWAVARNAASTPSRSASQASISAVGLVFPRSIWLRYSFEQRSAPRSDWVNPALTRSWRRRAPSVETGRACGCVAGGMSTRLVIAALEVSAVARKAPYRWSE